MRGTCPEFKGSRLGLGRLHRAEEEEGRAMGREKEGQEGAFASASMQNPRLGLVPAPPPLRYGCAGAVVVLVFLPSAPSFPESSCRPGPTFPRMQSVRKRRLLPLLLKQQLLTLFPFLTPGLRSPSFRRTF